jgi:rRNA maturation endonuclease Nob1
MTAEIKNRLWVLDATPLLSDFVPPAFDPLRDRLTTVPGVVAEIKDQASRERVQLMLRDHRLSVQSPSSHASAHVTEFAQRTGDYASLSGNDRTLLALAHQLHQSTPQSSEDQACKQVCLVYLVSDDYAVQNVSLQLKVPTWSSQRRNVVRFLKHFLLRCHACYWQTTKADSKFCGKCGNHGTLCKTSYQVDGVTGERKLFLRADYRYNLRGTKYSLPSPDCRQPSTTSLVLREDQREYQRHLRHLEKGAKKANKNNGSNVDQDLDLYLEQAFGESFRGLGATPSPSSGHGGNKGNYQAGIGTVGYGRRNPNATAHHRSSHK